MPAAPLTPAAPAHASPAFCRRLAHAWRPRSRRRPAHAGGGSARRL